MSFARTTTTANSFAERLRVAGLPRERERVSQAVLHAVHSGVNGDGDVDLAHVQADRALAHLLDERQRRAALVEPYLAAAHDASDEYTRAFHAGGHTGSLNDNNALSNALRESARASLAYRYAEEGVRNGLRTDVAVYRYVRDRGVAAPFVSLKAAVAQPVHRHHHHHRDETFHQEQQRRARERELVRREQRERKEEEIRKAHADQLRRDLEVTEREAREHNEEIARLQRVREQERIEHEVAERRAREDALRAAAAAATLAEKERVERLERERREHDAADVRQREAAVAAAIEEERREREEAEAAAAEIEEEHLRREREELAREVPPHEHVELIDHHDDYDGDVVVDQQSQEITTSFHHIVFANPAETTNSIYYPTIIKKGQKIRINLQKLEVDNFLLKHPQLEELVLDNTGSSVSTFIEHFMEPFLATLDVFNQQDTEQHTEDALKALFGEDDGTFNYGASGAINWLTAIARHVGSVANDVANEGRFDVDKSAFLVYLDWLLAKLTIGSEYVPASDNAADKPTRDERTQLYTRLKDKNVKDIADELAKLKRRASDGVGESPNQLILHHLLPYTAIQHYAPDGRANFLEPAYRALLTDAIYERLGSKHRLDVQLLNQLIDERGKLRLEFTGLSSPQQQYEVAEIAFNQEVDDATDVNILESEDTGVSETPYLGAILSYTLANLDSQLRGPIVGPDDSSVFLSNAGIRALVIIQLWARPFATKQLRGDRERQQPESLFERIAARPKTIITNVVNGVPTRRFLRSAAAPRAQSFSIGLALSKPGSKKAAVEEAIASTLVAAARDGDIDAIRAARPKNADDVRDALVAAARCGQADVIPLLVTALTRSTSDAERHAAAFDAALAAVPSSAPYTAERLKSAASSLLSGYNVPYVGKKARNLRAQKKLAGKIAEERSRLHKLEVTGEERRAGSLRHQLKHDEDELARLEVVAKSLAAPESAHDSTYYTKRIDLLSEMLADTTLTKEQRAQVVDEIDVAHAALGSVAKSGLGMKKGAERTHLEKDLVAKETFLEEQNRELYQDKQEITLLESKIAAQKATVILSERDDREAHRELDVKRKKIARTKGEISALRSKIYGAIGKYLSKASVTSERAQLSQLLVDGAQSASPVFFEALGQELASNLSVDRSRLMTAQNSDVWHRVVDSAHAAGYTTLAAEIERSLVPPHSGTTAAQTKLTAVLGKFRQKLAATRVELTTLLETASSSPAEGTALFDALSGTFRSSSDGELTALIADTSAASALSWAYVADAAERSGGYEQLADDIAHGLSTRERVPTKLRASASTSDVAALESAARAGRVNAAREILASIAHERTTLERVEAIIREAALPSTTVRRALLADVMRAKSQVSGATTSVAAADATTTTMKRNDSPARLITRTMASSPQRLVKSSSSLQPAVAKSAPRTRSDSLERITSEAIAQIAKSASMTDATRAINATLTDWITERSVDELKRGDVSRSSIESAIERIYTALQAHNFGDASGEAYSALYSQRDRF